MTTTATYNSLNKLDLSNAKLIGRQNELKQLNEIWKNVQQHHHRSVVRSVPNPNTNNDDKNDDDIETTMMPSSNLSCHAALIGGNSGTGKSALVDEFVQEQRSRTTNDDINNGKHPNNNNSTYPYLFGSGKFDQFAKQLVPYSALADALNEICLQMKSIIILQQQQHEIDQQQSSSTTSKSNDAQRVDDGRLLQQQQQQQFLDEIGTRDYHVLSNLIPNFEDLFDFRNNDENKNKNNRGKGTTIQPSPTSQTTMTTTTMLSSENAVALGDENGFTRLKLALQSFLNIVTTSTIQLPILLVLDDLQWADIATLDLLKFLLDRQAVHGLMIIGCYRDNEVESSSSSSSSNPPSHPLSTTLLEGLHSKHVYTKLKLDVLSEEDTNVFIADLLRLDRNETKELTKEVAYPRTHGNPFFLLQFIDSLTRKGLLTKSYMTMKWEWDINQIKSETVLTDNVVDIVTAKIQRLDKHAQELLKIGSCLGNTFDATVVERAFCPTKYNIKINTTTSTTPASSPQRHQPSSLSTTTTQQDGKAEDAKETEINVLELLDAVAVDQLIERTGSEYAVHMYRFSHDRVQQAAYQLIGDNNIEGTADCGQEPTKLSSSPSPSSSPSLRRSECSDHLQLLDIKTREYHYNVGIVLSELYKESNEQVEWQLLVGTEQLNLGRSFLLHNEERKLDLVQMNLAASRIVKDKSAFFSAAQYLRNAMDLLGPNRWKEYPNIAAEVEMLLAEMEYCSGDGDDALLLIDELLSRSEHISLEQQLEMQCLKTKIMFSQAKFQEALQYIRRALALVDINIPSFTWYQASITSFSLKRRLKKFSYEQILAVGTTENRVDDLKMQLLNLASGLAYMIGNNPATNIVTSMMFKLCLDSGHCPHSPLALSMWGFSLMRQGFCKEATSWSDLAQTITEKWRFQEGDAHLAVVHGWFIMPLYRPLPEALKFLEYGYNIGMATGDIMHGHFCAAAAFSFRFFLAHPLTVLSVDATRLQQEMADYQTWIPHEEMHIMRQIICNLMKTNPARNPAALEGEIIPDFNQFCNKIDGYWRISRIHHLSMLLAFLFGDLDRAREYATLTSKDGNKAFLVVLVPFYPFWRGMIWLDLFRKGDKKKKNYYRKLAMKELATLTKWTKQGLVNLQVCQLLLQADVQSLKPKVDVRSVRDAYEKAIAMASRFGLSLVAAISNERAADFMLEFDPAQAKFYARKSVKLMVEWGALGRVDFLIRKYNLSADDDDGDIHNVLKGTYLRGSKNYESAAKRHRESNWIKVSTYGIQDSGPMLSGMDAPLGSSIIRSPKRTSM